MHGFLTSTKQMHCTQGMQCNSLVPSGGLHSSASQFRYATLHQLGVRSSRPNCACLTKAKQSPEWTADTAADAGKTRLVPAAAAPVAPEIVLQAIPETGRVPLSGPLGDWSDVAVDRGYFKPQYQQQQQQQQRQNMKQRQRQQRPQQPWQSADKQQRQQQRQSKHHQQQRVQHGQKRQLHGSSPSRRRVTDPAQYAAALTVRIMQQDSVMGLLSVVTSTLQRGQLNLRHLSTICRVVVEMQQQQQRLQHQLQQQQLVDLDCTAELLRLVEQRVVVLLKDAAAAAAAAAAVAPRTEGGESSSSSNSQNIMPEPRSIATLVYCWGKLGYKPELEALQLLLDAFQRCYQAQQQQEATRLQQQQRNQQELGADACTPHESVLVQGPGAGTIAGSERNSQPCSSRDSDTDRTSPRGSFMSLANLCWGLYKLGYTCNSVYGSYNSRWNRFGHTLHSGSSSSSPGGSSISLQQQQHWAQLAVLVQDSAVTASSRDLSSICYAFAAGGYTDVVLWSRLAPHLIACMDDFLPQDLSQLLWAYATAGVRHEGLFSAAVPALRQTMQGFTPQGLVNVLWAYITFQSHVPEPLLQAASAELLHRKEQLAGFGPLNLSMLAWVFAKSRTVSPLLAAAISHGALQILPSFVAPDLCRLLSSLALLRSANAELLNAAESKLLSMLEQPGPDANIQVVTQGVWAFAASNHPGAGRLIEPLLSLAAKHVGVLVRSGDATCRLLDTLVLLRYRADGFVQVLADKLLGVAPADLTAKSHASNQAIATAALEPSAAAAAAGAGGTAAAPAPATAAARAAAAAETIEFDSFSRWSSVQLVRVAAALARLGYTQQHHLLQLLVRQFVCRLPSLTNAGSNKGGGSGGNRQQQPVHVPGTLVRQCVQLLWACAVLDVQQPKQCLSKLASLLRHAEMTGYQLPHVSLAQLVQAHMWLQSMGPAAEPIMARLPQGWLEQGLYFWQQEMVPAVTRSPLHTNVMSTLAAMRLPAVCEGVTPDGMFSVDVIVNFEGCEVALEVMGDEHYSSNTVVLPQQPAQQQAKQRARRKQHSVTQQLQQLDPATDPQHVLLGPELLRMRLLAARDYALAIVSSFDWERVKSKHAAQLLLKQRLQDAVAAHKQHQRVRMGGKAARSGNRLTAQQAKQASQQEQQGHVQDDGFVMLLQEQLSEGSLVAEQVGRLVQQQGRSKHTQRGLLRGERYKQQRQDLHQEGMQLLMMAAPWAAAPSKKHAKLFSRGDNSGSSITNSIVEWGADDGAGNVMHHEAKELEVDEDFDISLNLEDLLADKGKDDAALHQ